MTEVRYFGSTCTLLWTKRQRELVEAIIKAGAEGYPNPLKHAAEVVRMKYSTARNTVYKMRNRRDALEEALERYARWRRQLKGRRYL